MIRNIPNYTNFTTKIKGASKIKDDNDYKYQIILEYGGITINKINNNIHFNNFINLFNNLCNGIKLLQDHKIVHRDIKPTNVLILNNQLNLIDYGLSCNVNNVYSNDDDTNYLLSYMYMYNPPEFYIAYLLNSYKNKDEDFEIILEKIFEKLITYSSELKLFYSEHYYNYNMNEAYNIYSYKDGFNRFYQSIKLYQFKKYDEIFTEEIAFKSDIYSLSYILKCLKKYIIFDTIKQRDFFNNLFDMTYDLNPFTRSSITELLDYIATYS